MKWNENSNIVIEKTTTTTTPTARNFCIWSIFLLLFTHSVIFFCNENMRFSTVTTNKRHDRSHIKSIWMVLLPQKKSRNWIHIFDKIYRWNQEIWIKFYESSDCSRRSIIHNFIQNVRVRVLPVYIYMSVCGRLWRSRKHVCFVSYFCVHFENKVFFFTFKNHQATKRYR